MEEKWKNQKEKKKGERTDRRRVDLDDHRLFGVVLLGLGGGRRRRRLPFGNDGDADVLAEGVQRLQVAGTDGTGSRRLLVDLEHAIGLFDFQSFRFCFHSHQVSHNDRLDRFDKLRRTRKSEEVLEHVQLGNIGTTR